MSEKLYSLDDLARLKGIEEEERERLPYDKFVNILKRMVVEKNPKVNVLINEPKPNVKDEYLCIKEPLEFIELFREYTDQGQCVEHFKELLLSRDTRVVQQAIKEKEYKEGFWFNTTKEGINLRPGLKDEELSSPMPVVLGDDTVHALVGGRTGSGKSVFLNSIIFSLLAEYSPWELSMYLVDFKKVEFSRYLSKYDVPHIKAVAATSEIRYVLSMLTHLLKCMMARQDFFSLLGVQKISDFRKKYNIVLPRVLLIVDEFQQMFLEATGREQVIIEDTLTAITKLGRATGFHLMFASQEMTGTLNANVFNNFKAKFALACEPEVSNRLLGNSEASKISKKGIVLSNIGDANVVYKVPYISDEYFLGYLKKITELASRYTFENVHKFYREESIKDMSELEKILDVIKETRVKLLHENSGLVDIITLGESVVFNYKKYDYETVFLERGVRKNIGIFSPSVDDTVYTCKLLSSNFMSSPKKDKYNHWILARNDLFLKKMDIKTALGISKEKIISSTDFLLELIEMYERRKREEALLSTYYQYRSLKEFAYDALCLRVGHIISDITEDEKEVLYELASYFENKSVLDIPLVEASIMEDYEFDYTYFRVLDMLYEKEVNKKDIVDLYESYVIWILGAEMVGKFPKGMEKMLADASNYNILFVIAASNTDFEDFYMIHKTCDYIFVSGNNETYYNKLNIPYTKKSEKSIAIDFSISSNATQRSFKKFKYDLQEVIVPAIDFDLILK